MQIVIQMLDKMLTACYTQCLFSQRMVYLGITSPMAGQNKMSDKTPTYNLKAVVRETGLKSDTIRAWERRYGIPSPQRSDSGHRLYSQHDINTLKWLLERQNEGMNISRAIELWHRLESEAVDPFHRTTRPAHNVDPNCGYPHRRANLHFWAKVKSLQICAMLGSMPVFPLTSFRQSNCLRKLSHISRWRRFASI